ncbi:MAG: DUF2282 domain-containing protein [Alphaproteobacteria bacterium]|nr:DUF2282 domain-containing protein [Alphaproteobacteria bacterium]
MSTSSIKTLAAAVAGAVILAAAPSQAQGMGAQKGKEKCYGIAKAGENGCASANGSHSCAGQAKADHDGNEWKLVEAGSCVKMGGKLQAFEGKGGMEKKG